MSDLVLTPTQRRHLKQLSHHLKPLVHMGKEGPTPAFMSQVGEQLESHELIKIRVLNNCESTKEEIEAPFAEQDIVLVQKIGHVYTVYKAREEKPQIHLPKR